MKKFVEYLKFIFKDKYELSLTFEEFDKITYYITCLYCVMVCSFIGYLLALSGLVITYTLTITAEEIVFIIRIYWT